MKCKAAQHSQTIYGLQVVRMVKLGTLLGGWKDSSAVRVSSPQFSALPKGVLEEDLMPSFAFQWHCISQSHFSHNNKDHQHF